MDRFDAMQAFARVVETGSFTKAAQTMHISRASLTQLVQQLEARLQVKLLSRTTRKVRVTEAGTAFYQRVILLLSDLEAMEAEMAQTQGRVEGRLRVDVPSPLASQMLIPALPAFHRRHPGIRIDMRVSDHRVDLLDENIDCVIRGGPVTDGSLIARRLGELQLGTYAAPAYLSQMGEPQHPGELAGPHHRTVGYLWAHRNQPPPYVMRHEQQRVNLQGSYCLAVDDGNAYLAAGLAGLGILWLPQYLARQAVSQGTLVALFTDWQIDPMPLHALLHPSRRMNTRVRLFIDWAAQCIAAAA